MEALAATPRAAFLLSCTLYTPLRKLHGLRAIFFAEHTTCNAEGSSGILVHISTFGAGSQLSTSRADAFVQTTSDFTAQLTGCFEALPALPCAALVGSCACRTPHGKPSRSRTHCLPLLTTALAWQSSRIVIEIVTGVAAPCSSTRFTHPSHQLFDLTAYRAGLLATLKLFCEGAGILLLKAWLAITLSVRINVPRLCILLTSLSRTSPIRRFLFRCLRCGVGRGYERRADEKKQDSHGSVIVGSS